MKFERITQEMMRGKGSVGRPDTPGVSTAEMQRILDELPREVLAPAMNRLADQLESAQAASGLGALLPDGSPATVQQALAAARVHESSWQNPHAVTAAQVGAYTRQQTEEAISARVRDIGSADMNRAEYGGSAPGVVRDADRLGGQLPAHYTPAEEVQLFRCTFLLDGWQKTGKAWTQTAECSGMQAAFDTEPPFVQLTGVQETDDSLRSAMDQLAQGWMQTLDGQVRATLWQEPPLCDVELCMRRAVL